MDRNPGPACSGTGGQHQPEYAPTPGPPLFSTYSTQESFAAGVRRGDKLPDLHANSMPVRPPWQPPIHPNSHGATHKIVRGDEAHHGKSTVFAIVAIITHEKVHVWRH